jgi:hypothetical protein
VTTSSSTSFDFTNSNIINFLNSTPTVCNKGNCRTSNNNKKDDLIVQWNHISTELLAVDNVASQAVALITPNGSPNYCTESIYRCKQLKIINKCLVKQADSRTKRYCCMCVWELISYEHVSFQLVSATANRLCSLNVPSESTLQHLHKMVFQLEQLPILAFVMQKYVLCAWHKCHIFFYLSINKRTKPNVAAAKEVFDVLTGLYTHPLGTGCICNHCTKVVVEVVCVCSNSSSDRILGYIHRWLEEGRSGDARCAYMVEHFEACSWGVVGFDSLLFLEHGQGGCMAAFVSGCVHGPGELFIVSLALFDYIT